jgi:thiol:disulfide interchange protein
VSLVAAALTLVAGLARPSAQVTAPSAAALLEVAQATAGSEKKVVLVEFGASWCGWCRRFDAFAHSPEAGPLLAQQYVVVNMTVQESLGKRGLETPGAQALMDEWGGARAGLPFYVFLSDQGAILASSNAMPTGANLGYPATPTEIQAFAGLLDRTAPRLTADVRARIVEYLTTHAPR